jgi:hypothetical protein
MSGAGSSNDPYIFGELLRPDTPGNNAGLTYVERKTLRSSTLNTAQKNLVLFVAGDSNTSGVGTALFTPTNASAIDNFNVYDGANYNCVDPLVGCAQSGIGVGGNISGRIADLIVGRGSFARAIVVPLGIGGSNVGHWSSGGVFYNKIPAALARLAGRGITPSLPNVTFALIYMTGANDHGTTAANYKAGYQNVVTKAQDAGFVGRVFVPKYSRLNNVTDSGVTDGQASLIDNATYFFGGDVDSVNGATNLQADNTHFNATGQANVAVVIEAAMHASGSPF